MAYQKIAEATGDLISNNIAKKFTKIWKNSEKKNSETVTNENDKEIPKIDIYLQKEERKLLVSDINIIVKWWMA